MGLRRRDRVAGTMSGLAATAIHLAAVLSAAQLPDGFQAERVICRSQTGPIVERHLLMEEDQFEEQELRRVFARYLRGSGGADLYVLASSDPDFFRYKLLPEREVAMLLTEAPVAYFFRMGPHAFFQYGRAGGEIRWVVMQGENVLRRRFGQTELWWTGTRISTLAGKACEEGSAARLSFASPEVHETDLEEIARYYARLNRRWRSFALRIYPTFDVAAQMEGVRLCSLEGMPSCLRLLQNGARPMEAGPYLSYTFVRWGSGEEGELFRYDKTGLGPPTWTKRISLADPD